MHPVGIAAIEHALPDEFRVMEVKRGSARSLAPPRFPEVGKMSQGFSRVWKIGVHRC
jgi:hypothetical protein